MFRSHSTYLLLIALMGGGMSLSGLFPAGHASGQDAAAAEATDPETTDQASDDQAETSETDAAEPAESSDEKTDAKSDAGQEELDQAAILRFDAKSPRELQAVERLLQAAIKKGLSGENAAFAKKMLGSVLLQKAQQIVAAIGQGGGRPLQLRDEALRTLEEAVANDPSLVEAYLLVARLNMPPCGDKQANTEATTKAVEILDDNPVQRSAALVLRAVTWGPGDEQKRRDDLNAAIK